MRHARLIGLGSLAIATIAAVAFAQSTTAPLPEPAPVAVAPLATTNAVEELAKTAWGDAKNGATKAGACAACHGLDGNAMQQGAPRIGGQSERYISHQLALFKAGERTTGMAALMAPFAMALSAQDMRDLGAYYATQPAGAGVADDTVIASGPNAGKKFYEVGQTLYRNGDVARGIPACMACHGPDGAGNPGPAYPRIGGQDAVFVQRRLEEYRAGTTAIKDAKLFHVMASVAKPLTDEEVRSLASYLQGLHPRAAEASAEAVAAVAARPAPAPAAEVPAPATNAMDAPPAANAVPAAEPATAPAPQG